MNNIKIITKNIPFLLFVLLFSWSIAGSISCNRENPDNKSIGLESSCADGKGDRTNTVLYQNRSVPNKNYNKR
ncbi:MAG: hypothetical protein GY754_34770 [bacterium]|nr:hypothetical protein [bacterium]